MTDSIPQPDKEPNMTETNLTRAVTAELASIDQQIAELNARRTAAQAFLATMGGKLVVTKPRVKSSAGSKNGPSAERVWLSSQGHKVGDRGRIPAELHALWVEYEAKEAEKLNAENNPPAPPAPATGEQGNDKSSPKTKATTTRPRTASRASRASAKNTGDKAAA